MRVEDIALTVLPPALLSCLLLLYATDTLWHGSAADMGKEIRHRTRDNGQEQGGTARFSINTSKDLRSGKSILEIQRL